MLGLILKEAKDDSFQNIKNLLIKIDELNSLKEQLLDQLEKELASYNFEAESSEISKRNSFIYPRIGAEKRAIYAPRIGRNDENTSEMENKRAIYAPRIGRSQTSQEINSEKRGIHHPRIGK